MMDTIAEDHDLEHASQRDRRTRPPRIEPIALLGAGLIVVSVTVILTYRSKPRAATGVAAENTATAGALVHVQRVGVSSSSVLSSIGLGGGGAAAELQPDRRALRIRLVEESEVEGLMGDERWHS